MPPVPSQNAPSIPLPTLENVKLEEPRPHVLLVRIDREKATNALDNQTHSSLSTCWDYFENEEHFRVAVLTGTGKAFCAGQDLKDVKASREKGGPATSTPSTGFGGLVLRKTCMKPIISAVNGIAMGGGFELALASDIIIASEQSKFALPEVRVGLAALAGGAQNLHRQIGYQNAQYIALTGNHMTAHDMLRLGFVQEVVPNALNRALDLAHEIATQCSPDSIRATKRLAQLALENSGFWKTMEEGNNLPEVKAMMTGPNILEGTSAFAQKRKPRWLPASKL
jgi:enoyl-CoA hydratase/carnithine racemase